MKIVVSYQDARGGVLDQEYYSLPFGHASEQALREAVSELVHVSIDKPKHFERVEVYSLVTSFPGRNP